MQRDVDRNKVFKQLAEDSARTRAKIKKIRHERRNKKDVVAWVVKNVLRVR